MEHGRAGWFRQLGDVKGCRFFAVLALHRGILSRDGSR
jgi:hypothetical protein